MKLLGQCKACRFGEKVTNLRMIEFSNSCWSLFSVVRKPVDEILCRRFPKTEIHDPVSGCGEFQKDVDDV